MILIIGGIAQGKAAYARTHFPEADARMIRLNSRAEDWFAAKEDPEAQLEQLLLEKPDGILISEEIGNGVVPADPEERAFREWMGRLQVVLAAKAETVIRVVCGLGIKLK